VDDGTFDVGTYAAELDGLAAQPVGTRVLYEDDRVRVWDLDLAPGVRIPFHRHTTPYFFVCVDAGKGLSRFPNGTSFTVDYADGDTWFDDVSSGADVHDLENVGDTRLRFVTVELLDGIA